MEDLHAETQDAAPARGWGAAIRWASNGLGTPYSVLSAGLRPENLHSGQDRWDPGLVDSAVWSSGRVASKLRVSWAVAAGPGQGLTHRRCSANPEPLTLSLARSSCSFNANSFFYALFRDLSARLVMFVAV